MPRRWQPREEGSLGTNKTASTAISAHGRFSLKNSGSHREDWGSVSKSHQGALSSPQDASKSLFKKILFTFNDPPEGQLSQ